MVNKVYRFEEAQEKDIEDIADIEGEFFKDYSKAFDKEFLEKCINIIITYFML